MSIDILAALANEAPSPSSRKCKVQRWLDGFEPDTPGLADLAATIVTTDPTSPDYRTCEQTLRVLYRLGLATSTKTFGDHRAKRCRCFD